MKYSIVIPTKTPRNLIGCIAAIDENEPDLDRKQIIVVDDGLGDEWVDASRTSGLTVLNGAKPFVFARNCNIGIKHALEHNSDVVILLNDDATLETAAGFSALAAQAHTQEKYGIIAAACSVVGNPNQFPKSINRLRDEDRMVCFVCVAIPRRAFMAAGFLDERYVHYGMDDDDYSFEVRKRGFKLGVFDGCVVGHDKLTSSFRGDPKTSSDFRQNMQIFIDKWGHDNWYLPAEQARKKWAV